MTEDLTVTAEPSLDGESHWTCCFDDNLALCGADVTDHAVEKIEKASCVVCEDLADVPEQCPKFMRCIDLGEGDDG